MRVTADYVQWHGRRRPDAAALVRGDRTVTYAGMAADLRRVTRAIASLRLTSGSLVAVSHSDPYRQILLVLGSEQLGFVIAQFQPPVAPPEGAALVMTDQPGTAGCAGGLLQVDHEWWQTALSAPDPSMPHRQTVPEEPVLLLRSSGTTGVPKRMLVSRRTLQARVEHRARLLRLGRTSRCLMTMPLTVAGIHYSVIACLRLGATIVQPAAPASWQDVVAGRVTHATMLPMHLRRLLADLPDRVAFQPQLTLCVIGAALPVRLRRHALARWCGKLVSVYSSNEAGTICVVRPDGTGDVVPDAVVDIVGPDGRTVRLGETGRIRVRGPGVATGYVLPDGGVGAFRDGWFQTGDLGCLLPEGQLRVLGRHDDVVNLGGIKRSCEDVEEAILRRTGLQDVAVFTAEDHRLGQVLVVCAVAASPVDAQETIDACRMMSGCPVSLWFLGMLPRTEHGKLRRGVVREMVKARNLIRRQDAGSSSDLDCVRSGA